MSVEDTRSRDDDADHKNHVIEDAISGGRFITRVMSSVRVSRMLSFEVTIVARNAPSGLGSD